MKKRVLQVAFNDLGHGGIQAVMLSIAQNLSDEYDFDVVSFSSKPSYWDKEFRKYGHIFYVPHYEGSNPLHRKLDYYIRYFKVKRDIYRILIENGPYDIIHAHTFFECAPVLAAAQKAGVPVRIAHSHNTAQKITYYSPKKLIDIMYQRVYRKIIRKNATLMVGCSQQAADYLFGIDCGRAVYNAIDLKRFNPAMYPKCEHRELRLIHVGNFIPQKNQLFLVDVFDHIKRKHPDVTLTMIGRFGAYKEQVLQKIEQLHLSESVHLLPHDSDIPKELSQSDIFVFPSTFEGFGNVLIEAQAMGLRCFVSTEVTHEADCGLLTFIPLSRGAEGWANEINQVITKNGKEKRGADVSRFSPEQTTKVIRDMYAGNMV